MAGAKHSVCLAIAAASSAWLAGCGQSPPTQFFTLDPVAPANSSQVGTGAVLRIDHVTIPSFMDRPELVREHAADRLKVDDFSHWGAPLGDLMRATLIEDLTARLPSGRVLPTGTPKPEGAIDLTVEVAAIHEGASGLIADVDWTITQPQTGGANPLPVVRTLRHERIEAPLNNSSQQAFAAALSQVMGLLSDRIVTELPPT